MTDRPLGIARSIAIGMAWLLVASSMGLGTTTAADAAPRFSEDFEDGLSGWSVNGTTAQADCSTGDPGCSLLHHPDMDGDRKLRVSQEVDVPLADQSIVWVSFRANDDAEFSDTDNGMNLHFEEGGRLNLQLTWKIRPNDGVSLRGETRDDGFVRWDPGQWYQAKIRVNTVHDLAQATIFQDGEEVGSSEAIQIAANATAISEVEFRGTAWHGDDGSVFHWDSLVIEDGPPCQRSAAGPASITRCPGDLVLRQTAPAPAGSQQHVVGHLDRYAFDTPNGGNVTVSCVVLDADSNLSSPIGTGANPCAAAGGEFDRRVATLVDRSAPGAGASLAEVSVCSARISVSLHPLAGVGGQPFLTPCSAPSAP